MLDPQRLQAASTTHLRCQAVALREHLCQLALQHVPDLFGGRLGCRQCLARGIQLRLEASGGRLCGALCGGCVGKGLLGICQTLLEQLVLGQHFRDLHRRMWSLKQCGLQGAGPA